MDNNLLGKCYLDNKDIFWALSEEKKTIWRFDTTGQVIDTIVNHQTDVPDPTNMNWDFLADSRGNYFFGGEYGLIQFDLATKRFRRFKLADIVNSPEPEVHNLIEDCNKNLWIASTTNGLFFL